MTATRSTARGKPPSQRDETLLHSLRAACDDLDESVAFYRAYCGLEIVKQHGEGESRVAWLAIGDDSKSGLTRAEAIKSWKRLMQLSKGDAEWVFMEGAVTEDSLMKEKIDEAAARVAARKNQA
jgi:catechol 2,3-dioxygenase-like lactoylglutathione lyase family enzyme